MDRIAIIDGNSLINRAYYAMRNPMITKDGVYTHAIFGFLNMLDKLRRDYQPKYMVVAFDKKGPTFRHEEYPEYKAGRRKMPPELAMQIPILKEILDAMNITRMELDGYEADDIIGTVSLKAGEEGIESVIFTGDKDQLQLVDRDCRVVFTKKGVSEFDIYDEESFREKYGFAPLQFIDFKGLAGDKSDNIPGIPGVGEKSATKLIMDYGSVEEIIAHAEEIKPQGLSQKVKDNSELALLSKKLATIDRKAPLEDEDADSWIIGEMDRDELIDIYKRLEFNRFLKKMGAEAASAKAGEKNGEASHEKQGNRSLFDLSSVEVQIIKDTQELKKLSPKGEVVIKVFGDNAHVSAPSIMGMSMLWEGKLYYFDMNAHGETEAFCDWFSSQDISLTGHDLKRDIYMLMSVGVMDFDVAFDTQIAGYCLDPSRSDYSLPLLSLEERGEELASEKDLLEAAGQVDMFSDMSSSYADYALKWSAAVLDVKAAQEERIREGDLEKVLYDIELPLVSVMASMEHEGFKADGDYLVDFGKELAEEIDNISASIYEMAGEEFNINSTQQLGNILFEKMGLPHGRKTKTGFSTSAEVLERLQDKHDIIPAILEYRSLSKLKSTYIDGLLPLISQEDGKIRAHFMQTVAATGRISCVEPNLQNIPIRQELGRKLRKAFVPDDDSYILVGADYSQIELRVLAHMADDPVLIDAFNKGEDIHRATASNVLGIPEDEITLEERSRAKAVNFGVIYGMSAFGLSSNLNISRKEAEDYIEAYFQKHEKVKEFMDESVKFCKYNGYVETMFGRRRYIKEIRATQYNLRQIGERLAMNSPIQGSAADIIKIAMVKVDGALKDAGLRSRLILQIHDELIIHTLKSEKKQVEELLVSNMEDATEMKVALKADLNEGDNWYELK